MSARVFVNGRFISAELLDSFEGPSDEELFLAHRDCNHRRLAASRRESGSSSAQCAARLRRYTPRTGKYADGLVDGKRIK